MRDRATTSETFFEALRAGGPLERLAPRLALYDGLLGDWAVEVIDHDSGGKPVVQTGEVHFAWVLEGRAIQDVWIVPARADRRPDAVAARNRYGTTLRVYDPKDDVWRVTWINPVSGVCNQLVGRARGLDILQEGSRPDGSSIRWIFSDITADSFRWRGEVSRDGGKTWTLETEFLGRRAHAARP